MCDKKVPAIIYDDLVSILYQSPFPDIHLLTLRPCLDVYQPDICPWGIGNP